MTIYTIIETLFIGPLKLIFEVIFETAYRITGHPGLSIIFLSLAMNILVLPLYRRADIMQEEIRDKEAELQDVVKHINKTFSGDERMMILRTYYRHNHYKPTDSLKGSVSLLLQIPFFMAAYQFLSHLEILQGVSLGPITDLGAPDGLLMIGGIAINILPILMTLINVVSGALYAKGFPLKTKVQMYGIALVFLILLYRSPACLVFYWTLNNVFSLIKNILYKLKNPAKILRILCAAVGLVISLYGVLIYRSDHLYRREFVITVGLLLILPLVLSLVRPLFSSIRKKALPYKSVTKTFSPNEFPPEMSQSERSTLEKLPPKSSLPEKETAPDGRLFLFGALFLTILMGLLIPSVFIGASPQEYVDLNYFYHPLWYIVRCLCMAAGAFLIWTRVFYWLASSKGKVIFGRLVWILCGITLVNYMFFGTNLGIISSSLQYKEGMWFSSEEKMINLLILLAVAAIMYFLVCQWKNAMKNVLIVSVIAIGVMSAWNLITIKTSVDQISAQHFVDRDMPNFQLSTSGQNVVVIMLDCAMGEYIPYLFQEKPELKEQFAGFTYYENTIAFGGHTNFGSPPLFGGYEYTPVEMNRRSDESLILKHNEALKVMPVIFSENGFDVTVCDPSHANYQYIPDLSIYDDCPGVTAYITMGQFGDDDEILKQMVIDRNDKNFFCFSVMKTMPLFLQPVIYSDGRYYPGASNTDVASQQYTVQTRDSISVADGKDADFLDSYNVLLNLPVMTDITEDKTDTFLLMVNATTHDPMLLQEPDYTPVWHVDNTLYDMENADRFTINGRELITETWYQMMHYQANMAAMIQLGNWFDYLRENGAYDNTRIILVSDHGRDLGQLEEFIMDDGSDPLKDMEFYYPLLMVKDYGSGEFMVSDTFMTNADVPTLAMEGIISNPVNPFTGKPINSDEKTAHDQFIILSDDFITEINNGNTFLPAAWASVHDNIWDRNNWTIYDVQTVLDEYAAP